MVCTKYDSLFLFAEWLQILIDVSVDMIAYNKSPYSYSLTRNKERHLALRTLYLWASYIDIRSLVERERILTKKTCAPNTLRKFLQLLDNNKLSCLGPI